MIWICSIGTHINFSAFGPVVSDKNFLKKMLDLGVIIALAHLEGRIEKWSTI